MILNVENKEPTIAILGIGTAVPPHRLDQHEVSLRLAEALADHRDAARWAKRIFKQCGVETRYTCEPNLLEPVDRCRYVVGTVAELVPTTAERMRKYKEHAVPLGMEAAEKALRDSGITPTDVTHLITVSCTGLFLPGLDIVLIQRLGLASAVQRIPLTFQGCAAGLTAVRLANDVVRSDPTARVLIVCVELCTLHIQPSSEREALFAAAFFGDGASACVVGEPTSDSWAGFVLGDHHAVVLPCSTEEMVWDVGNYGFDLYLSPNVPKLIGQFVPPELEKLLGESALVELWAIHPGGRGIIDTVQSLYELTDAQVRASRSVLQRYGNLSSATILYVLDEMRWELEQGQRENDERNRDGHQGAQEGIALAFGPGMHAEMMRIAYVRGWNARNSEGKEQAARCGAFVD